MSGWIRIEKDLATTMRFRRVVRAVKESNALRGVTNCDDSFVTTLVIGALARFWTYADSHITDDNTLAITLDEIDDLVGVQGFAKALPADWLHVIDADNVKLPDFLEHNGTSAKQRKDAARRQATYRKRHHHSNVTQESRVTNARNGARPDQDQTRPRPDTQEAARVPDVPRGTIRDADEFDSDWLDANWPKTIATERNSAIAIHYAAGLVGMGKATWTQLRHRVIGFRAFCDTGGFSAARIPGMSNWFRHDHPQRYWEREWAAVPSKTEQRVQENIDSGLEWLRQQEERDRAAV